MTSSIGSPATRAALAVAILCSAGCGGKSSGLGPHADTAPGQPVLTAEPAPPNGENVLVRWTRPEGELAGMELQGAVDAGAFEPLHGGLLDSWAPGVEIPVPPAFPELIPLRFRVRAVSLLGKAGPWSAEATIPRPIRGPQNLYAAATYAGGYPQGPVTGIQVSWFASSAEATGWHLERRVVYPDASATAWTTLPLPYPADHYTDTDLEAYVDGATYAYRLAATLREARSLAPEASPARAALLAPGGLSSSAIDGGVRLAWTNRSAWGSEIAVLRTPAPGSYGEQEVALLPPTATSFDDTGLAFGRYGYVLEVRRPVPGQYASRLVGRSAGVAALPLPPPEWGPLAATAIPVATGSGWAARSTAGFFFTTASWGSAKLQVPSGGAWIDRNLSNGVRLERPGMLLDAQGRPHVVYRDGPAYASWSEIVHEWLADGAWQREVIARRFLSDGDGCQLVRAALAADGALHVVWMAGPDPALGLEYATNRGGSWAVESVTDALPAARRVRYAQMQLSAGADGTVDLLLNDWGTPYLATRSAGTWAIEEIPGGLVQGSYLEGEMTVARGGARTLVVAKRGAYPQYELVASVRDGTGWKPGEVLGTSNASPTRAAVSPDGTRLAVGSWGGAGEPARISVLEPDGAWRSWKVLAPSATLDLDFGAGGKLWVLDRAWSDPGAAILYDEP